MMGKSPLMKKLVGNQSKLPEHLKAKIEAAPESPAKLKKASPAKNGEKSDKQKINEAIGNAIKNTSNFVSGRYGSFSSGISEGSDRRMNESFSAYTKRKEKEGKELEKQKAAEKLGPVLDGLPKSEFNKTASKIMEGNQPTGNISDIIGSSKNNSVGEVKKRTDSTTAEKTQEIAGVKNDSKSSVSLGDSKNISGRSSNPSKLSSMIGGNASVQAGRDAMALAGSRSMGETVKDKVTDKVQVGSGSTKRLPIDAMQDRLTKNIDRRSRKADVRKQTRTAKKSLRQEGSTRKEAKDKVGKLGINPNTGKSFENAKQKQDFINAKGKDTFISDLQKKASKTMKKGGVDPNISNKKVLSPESKKSVSTPSKKPKVPNIKTVPVAKRPALYDDGYDKKEEENNRMNRIMGTPSKMMKKAPTKMKTKTPNKMMKKAPSKMMKKAAAPKMMKKAPAKMMKKKKK